MTEAVDDNNPEPDRSQHADRDENELSGDEPAGGARGLSVSELIDAERSQIGHDLHDQLLPLIFAASANLQAVLEHPQARESSEGSGNEGSGNEGSGNAAAPRVDSLAEGSHARERITQATEWLREAMTVGRNLLVRVYPPELKERPWLAATRETVGRICQGHCRVEWKVDLDSTVCQSGWDLDIAAAAYRIVVESVRNAIRHGEADLITITAEQNRLVIADDGKGFDPESVPAGHFGIRSMKGRAELVGQNLTIDSRPGGPTKVTMRFTE